MNMAKTWMVQKQKRLTNSKHNLPEWGGRRVSAGTHLISGPVNYAASQNMYAASEAIWHQRLQTATFACLFSEDKETQSRKLV